jgi:hypothetical protein
MLNNETIPPHATKPKASFFEMSKQGITSLLFGTLLIIKIPLVGVESSGSTLVAAF